jgi:hypothetical protein
MSRKGNPYDNALAESFVATLKAECFAGQIPPTRAAAKLMIFDDIETFYNPRRRHSALAYRSPIEFEKTNVPPKQKQLTSIPNPNPKAQAAFPKKDQNGADH